MRSRRPPWPGRRAPESFTPWERLPIGTDLPTVIRVLEQVARDSDHIAETPPPKAIVVRMGPDFLGLELHAWTERVDQWMEIRSDLAVAAAAALAAAKIPVR